MPAWGQEGIGRTEGPTSLCTGAATQPGSPGPAEAKASQWRQFRRGRQLPCGWSGS